MSQQLLVEYPLVCPPALDYPLARGADGVLRYGNLTPALTELLDLRVHAFPTREAVVEIGGPRFTYRELWHRAARIAGGLQEQGIGYGDRVAVHLPSGARWVQAFLGALLSGAVPVLVHDGLSAARAERMIADSDANFVLGDAVFPDGVAYIDDGAALDDLALLCYTSGAARGHRCSGGADHHGALGRCDNHGALGRCDNHGALGRCDNHGALGRVGGNVAPKGVELTNENLLSAICSVVGALDLPTDGLRNMVLLPLAHASGCVDQLLATFAVGGTVVLAPDSARLAHAIEDERVDMISATPRVFARLLPELAASRRDGPRTEGVSRISNAGHHAERIEIPARRPHPTVALREVFPVARQWSVWGATETSGIGLAVDIDGAAADHDHGAGAGAVLGFPFGGTELALFGPRAGAGRGELLCRGPNVTRRYWKDPRTTEDRFTGGWFRTGDQVTIDADGLVRRATVD